MNRQIFPKYATYPTKVEWFKRAWYYMPGYNAKSHQLVFTDIASPMYALPGMDLRIWYGEDLIDIADGNNGGKECADVYAMFS